MEVMPNRFVKAGEVVFREGDLPDEGLFYICKGTVEVARQEPAGTRVLAELSAGAVFGEMGIINTDLRNATVTAKTDCDFYTITRNSFQARVEQLEPFMRGVFRSLVLSLRDFAAHREQWLLALEAQEAAKNPKAVHYEPVRPEGEGGGLAAGEARKLQF